MWICSLHFAALRVLHTSAANCLDKFCSGQRREDFLSQCPSSAKGDRRRCCDATEAGTRAGAANAAPTATFLPRLPGSCTKGATAQGIRFGNFTIPVNARDPAPLISPSLLGLPSAKASGVLAGMEGLTGLQSNGGLGAKVKLVQSIESRVAPRHLQRTLAA